MAVCSTRCESTERILLAASSTLILLAWVALFFSDVNHPPGVRTARLAGAALVIAIGILEYVRPWWGFCAFLIFWPQMMVARELLQKVLGPTWGAFPTITTGPLAAALVIGFTLRNWKLDRDPAFSLPPASPEKSNTAAHVKWIRIALWCLAATWTLSAAIATIRLMKGPPAGWHVDPADWRHASGPSAFSVLAPAASALRTVPEFLLGLVLFNDLARKNRARVNAPIDRMLTCIAIGAALVAVELLLQLALNRDWAFDDNPPSGPFNNRNTTSPVLLFFGLLCLAAQSRQIEKVLWQVLSAICIGLACVISSRNGLFMAAVLGTILLTLRLKRPWIVLVVAAMGLAICFWAPLPKSESLSLGTTRRVVETVENARAGNWDAVTSYRSELYRSAFKIFGSHPILGSGPATFPMLASPGSIYAVTGYGAYFSAHSMPLNLAAETGIFGMLAWLALWLAIPCAMLWKKFRSSWLWIAVLMFGIANLFDTVWFAAGMGTLSMLMLWFACADDTVPAGPVS